MDHFRVTVKVVVVVVVVVIIDIYLYDYYYYYYYDSGHFQVAFGMGCQGPEKVRPPVVHRRPYCCGVNTRDQTESNRTRLSMNSRRMLPVGPFRCFAMMISAMFFGYSWPGCI